MSPAVAPPMVSLRQLLTHCLGLIHTRIWLILLRREFGAVACVFLVTCSRGRGLKSSAGTSCPLAACSGSGCCTASRPWEDKNQVLRNFARLLTLRSFISPMKHPY